MERCLTGSQEVAGSILVSSTIPFSHVSQIISNLAWPPRDVPPCHDLYQFAYF